MPHARDGLWTWLIAERRIRFYKIGRYVRIDSRDLDAFVEAGRVDPAQALGECSDPHDTPDRRPVRRR